MPAPLGPMMPTSSAVDVQRAAVEDVDLGHVAGDEVGGLDDAVRPTAGGLGRGSSGAGASGVDRRRVVGAGRSGRSSRAPLLGLDGLFDLGQHRVLLLDAERGVVVGAQVGVDHGRVGGDVARACPRR